MVDINTQFGGFLTTQGAAKKTNCDALGVPWKLTHMLLGDANGADPVPAPGQTQLVHQVHRAPLNQLYASPTDPNVLIAELVLPPDVGGWWIRELALEDEAGVFSAVANCAPSYKPSLAQNSGRNQVVRMHILTSSTANIQLKIDPSVVLATRQYVDERTYTYVPVQQGGGIKQTASTANKIFIGFSTDGSGRLSATVDTTDLGHFAFTSNLQALLDQILDNVPAELNTLKKLALAIGNDPEYAQNVIRELANKADSATTLEGYSIPIASQPEAEEGAENTKPTTSLRVAQYVTKVLKGFQEKLGFIPVQQGGGVGQTDSDQNKIFIGFGTNSRLKATVDSTDLGNIIFDSNTAQEGASGIIKLATIAEVQQGSETLKAVTPKNLRMGFFIGLGMNGYIVFPTWMGSFMVQWGRYSLPAPTGSQVAVNYPIPFGTVLHAWAGVDGGASDQIGTFGLTATAMTVSKGSADTSPRNGSWFAIGGAF